MRNTPRLAIASVAALAVGALAVSTLSADSALAAGPSALIDPSADTSLTIHKHVGTPTGPGNGQPTTIDPEANPPLAGIAFDIYRVDGVDVTTDAGRAAAAGLVGVAIPPTLADGDSVGEHTVSYVSTVTTGSDGSATFAPTANDVGVYVVVENLAKSTIDDAMKSRINPVAPFVVTLPMTNATTNTEWDYDVDVYPKNQTDSALKQVLDGNLDTPDQDTYAVGQILTYTLTGTITAADYNGDSVVDSKDISLFMFTDTLAPELSEAKSTFVQIVPADGGTPVPLTINTHYTFTATPNQDGTTSVEMKLNDKGLNEIAKYNGDRVEFAFRATVKAMPSDGVVRNKGYFIPSGQWKTSHPDSPGVPTDTVQTKFGDIVIKKVSAHDPAQALSGAEFSVFRDANGDGKCVLADDITDKTAIAITEATADDGLTKASGLQLSNWYNNALQKAMHGYCLVETKAPEGFELLAEPTYFTLTKEGAVADLDQAFADANRDANAEDNTGGNRLITDMPSNFGNVLPNTGGSGAGLIGFAGLAIAAGAGGGMVIRRRRRDLR